MGFGKICSRNTLVNINNTMSIRKIKDSFTLIEILLSVALIGALSFIAMPVFNVLINRHDGNVAANSVVQSLRRAQMFSQAVDDDTTWGVKIKTGSITLFKGEDYDSREDDFDEVFKMPNTVGIEGINEVVFSKFTGFPQTTGTLTLTAGGESHVISINEKGTISF